MPRFAVIFPAAGRSSRFKDKEKKPFVNLDGRPVWMRSVELFVNRDDVCQCILILAPEDQENFKLRNGAHVALLGLQIADGGRERFDSVANALKLLKDEAEFVAIHDAVRPCLDTEQIDAVFTAAASTGAALLAVPVADTLKRSDPTGKVIETVPRENLWMAQTPQVFRRDWLLAAYAARDKLGSALTDDAQLVEAAGREVRLVEGSSFNIKITSRNDLTLAAAILQAKPKPKEKRPIHPFAEDEMWGTR
jgi:2-C-methyl-D-erythritol 4-phosphate cytidylyltransferase